MYLLIPLLYIFYFSHMYPPSYFKMLLHLFFVFLVFPNKYNYNKYLSKYHVGHIDDFNTLYLVI